LLAKSRPPNRHVGGLTRHLASGTYVDSEVENGRRFANSDRIGSTNAFPFAFPDHQRLPNRHRFAFPDRIGLMTAYPFVSPDSTELPNRRPFASPNHPAEANQRRLACPNRSQLMAGNGLRRNSD
jgi:hypothetical protein